MIIWNMDKIKQNLQKSLSDQTEYIVTVIDDFENVIDAVKFANEAACQTIQSADYSKIKLQINQGDLNQTSNTSGEKTQIEDENEEGKDNDESTMGQQNRLTTKEKVQKLKDDLKKRKELLKGGKIESQIDEDGEIQIDTSKQEIEAGQLKQFVATGSRDKKVRIFEVKSGVCVVTLVGHDNWVTDLLFHPNGKYLISTADDKSIRIWDLQYGRCYRKIYNAHAHFISCFDMKSKYAASGSVDTSVKLWKCK